MSALLRPVYIAGQEPIPFTASFGVAALTRGSTEEPMRADMLLRQADVMMYRSKRDGRNRVTAPAAQRVALQSPAGAIP